MLLIKIKADECLFPTRRCQRPATGCQGRAAHARPGSARGAGRAAMDLSLCMRRRMLSRLLTQTMYSRRVIQCTLGVLYAEPPSHPDNVL